MTIRIPGLEGIDIDEVLGRVPQSRPPLNKKRPLPKPPVNLENVLINKSPIDMPVLKLPSGIGIGGTQLGERITGPDAFNKMFGKGESSKPDVPVGIPGIINIPGLGPIEMPQAFEPPEQIEDFYDVESLFDEENVINENPIIGERPDGSPVFLYDDDSDDYLDYEEDEPDPSQPVETQPVETQPVETQPIQAPPSPDPFKDYVPRNILGASFDPKDVSAQKKMVADARARMTPGANIQGGGYLTYDNPLLGNKQTQFGGYGQPMPTAPLMNYAGMSSPTTYSKPKPDPDKEIIR